MLLGTRALMAGVVVVLLSVWAGSPPLFFVGTAVAGVGFGAGFQGGIRLVAPLAHPDQRAGVLSVLFSISYVALGVPAVVAGVAVVQGGGLVATSYVYGLAVIALAATATFNLIRLRQTHAPTRQREEKEGVVPMTETRTQLHSRTRPPHHRGAVARTRHRARGTWWSPRPTGPSNSARRTTPPCTTSRSTTCTGTSCGAASPHMVPVQGRGLVLRHHRNEGHGRDARVRLVLRRPLRRRRRASRTTWPSTPTVSPSSPLPPAETVRSIDQSERGPL